MGLTSAKKSNRASKNTSLLILDAAEELLSMRGYDGVSMREIAKKAQVSLGSVTYYFETKESLLAAIYDRYTQPMNQRRMDLLAEAMRISDQREKLLAIVRAYIIPTFSSKADDISGGARFTRIRAMLSMQGHQETKKIIAGQFDVTTKAFLDAFVECFPQADRTSIVWRSHFLLGSLYYTLVNGERIDRLTEGAASSADHDRAIEELSHTFAAAFTALDSAT